MDTHIAALQQTAHDRRIADIDHILSLRLAGGSYKAITEATGWSLTKIKRICQEEL